MKDKEHTRICPKCKTTLYYFSKYERNRFQKRKVLCRKCSHIGKVNGFLGKHHTEEYKKKASEQRKGIKQTGKQLLESRKNLKLARINQNKNGKNNYERWKTKYGEEEANRRDIEFRKKQSKLNSGTNNPMYGKPTPQGSGNGWACWYKNIHFRSLRELSYFIFEIEQKGLKWENGQSGRFNIKYIGINGEQRTYRPDFFIENKFLIEIKPKKLWNCIEVQLKKNAAEIFCKEKGFEYKLVDVEPNSEILKDKYLNGEIKFVDKYKTRFEKYAKIKN